MILPKAGLERVPVPCGKCPPCKLRRVNQWVFRLMQEEKRSSSAHFVTLTYDTTTVPISANGFPTLKKLDLQNYFKRLRKLCPKHKIKYYAVGEYGTKNKRPHYHAIIYNVPDTQLFFDAWSINGQHLGSIHIGQVNNNSVAYTMKYIDKPHYKRLHGRDDRAKEFPIMSKQLGANYLSDAVVKYHQRDLTTNFVTQPGGQRIALPRYYRQKIYTDEQVKIQHQIIKRAVDNDDKKQQIQFQQGSQGNEFDFDYHAYKDACAHGRYKHFYSQQKNRDV